jgi:hypothetical protein
MAAVCAAAASGLYRLADRRAGGRTNVSDRNGIAVNERGAVNVPFG